MGIVVEEVLQIVYLVETSLEGIADMLEFGLVRIRKIDNVLGKGLLRRLELSFKEILGHSITSEILSQRLTLAKRLIKTSRLDIGEIQIDDGGDIDQIRDPLHRLLENLIRLL